MRSIVYNNVNNAEKSAKGGHIMHFNLVNHEIIIR